MFQLVQEDLGSDQAVLLGVLEQEMSSPYHIQFLTKIFMNHMSNGGLVNLQLSDE